MCINTSKSSGLFQDCLCTKTKHFSVLQKYSQFFDRLDLITWSLISLRIIHLKKSSQSYICNVHLQHSTPALLLENITQRTFFSGGAIIEKLNIPGWLGRERFHISSGKML